MDKKRELLIRAYLVMFFFIGFAGIIAFRVFTISVLEGEKWRSKGAHHIQWRTQEADRGSIYADDHSLLVTTLPFFDIRMDTKIASDYEFFRNIDSLSQGLYKLNRQYSPGEWKQVLTMARRKGNRYFLLAKNVTADDLDLFRSLPLLRRGRYGGGLIIERKSIREKPYGNLAGRTLGEYRENSDKVGLEAYYEKFLAGPVEQKLMKEISSGIWVPLHDLDEHEAEKGDDIYTTLNIVLQDVAHNALLETLKKYDAKEGTVIAMEVETGAIKAMVNLNRSKSGRYEEIYNCAVAKNSEPGSTIKTASVLAMLEDGLAGLSSGVDLGGGKKKFFDRMMYDSKQHGIHTSDLREAFEISSNVGIAGLAHKYYNANAEMRKKFYTRLCSFGLCDISGIDLLGEPKPYIKDPEKDKKIWYGTTIPWMSHGYEMHLTPLQQLSFYNAIANNGKWMKPYLVSEIRNKTGTIKKFKPIVVNERIASESSIKAIKELLEGVVTRGTAKNIRSNIITMAGKTGTTRIDYNQEEEVRKYNASFAGYFPSEKPKYSMMIVVYEPKGAYYGSSVAAPVFKEIAERYTIIDQNMHTLAAAVHPEEMIHLPGKVVGNKKDLIDIMEYVQIGYKDKSRSNWVEMDPFESRMLVENKRIQKAILPDVRGMGARDAIYVLENLGYQVAMEGAGKVYKQSLPPGIENRGQQIRIYLN